MPRHDEMIRTSERLPETDNGKASPGTFQKASPPDQDWDAAVVLLVRCLAGVKQPLPRMMEQADAIDSLHTRRCLVLPTRHLQADVHLQYLGRDDDGDM